ncbi:serine/threonine protein kinase [Myxococcaceae bacterium GXIMD 01537]
MAELFLALQAGLEGFTKVVALKRVLPHLATSQSFIDMFLDEARLAARLDHANIVRIYDFGEANGRYYLAMEYLPGEDAARVVAQARKTGQRIPVDIAASIISGAAAGLHFAHELTGEDGRPLGLVHRDATPSNIIVTYYGAVKMVDFGVAKTEDNVHQTQAGQVKGKLSYLAPEQVRGEGIDRRADIFCLGIVLWEMLTGRKLFSRENAVAAVHAVLNEDAPAPSSLRPDVPPELDAIVLKALAKRPEDRFQTCGEFEDALDSYFALRSGRPTARHLAAFLEGLFGKERADSKRSIAQGRDLTTNISVVMKLLSPAPGLGSGSVANPMVSGSGRLVLPGTVGGTSGGSGQQRIPSAISYVSHPSAMHVVAPPPPPLTPLSWRVGLAAAFAVVSVALTAGGVALSKPAVAAAAPPSAPVTLTVESEPPGAFIFLRGEPTGLRTPATFKGLHTGTPVPLRLEKEGFEAGRETVTLEPGQALSRRLALRRLEAVVTFPPLPFGAQLQVDGRPHPADRELRLPPGAHTFEVLVNGQPPVSRTIQLPPGPQRISLDVP